MKLVTIMKYNRSTLGVKMEEGIVDIAAAVTNQPSASQQVPTEVMDVINGGEEASQALQSFIESLDTKSNSPYVFNENEIDWGPCVTNPSKIICVGLNYRKHAVETNAPYPDSPILFNKFNNTLTGDLEDIADPESTEELDYEDELGIVIVETAKVIPIDKALDNVVGYRTSNDLSARVLKFKKHQWLLGKTCEGFRPVGPY